MKPNNVYILSVFKVKQPYSHHQFVDMYTRHFIMCLFCNAVIFAGVMVIILIGQISKNLNYIIFYNNIILNLN